MRRYCDGFVSLEVSPRLARDTVATVTAAKRLAAEVGRPNVMIKIPATKEGLPAITEVLGAGINVNVTLIFSLERYNEVITAWMEGLELALTRRSDIAAIASVASFFLSRVDVAVDPQLPEGDPLRGQIANAQAAGAYEIYRRRMASDRAVALLAAGAQVQRPLWASTSTKNPAYPDLLYVDTIVADETVNTMPDATLAAVLDHGNFADSKLLNDDEHSSVGVAARRTPRQRLARGRRPRSWRTTASPPSSPPTRTCSRRSPRNSRVRTDTSTSPVRRLVEAKFGVDNNSTWTTFEPRDIGWRDDDAAGNRHHTAICSTPRSKNSQITRSRGREQRNGCVVTYSPKVFIPLTKLCRDRCGYCTFAQAPAHVDVAVHEP